MVGITTARSFARTGHRIGGLQREGRRTRTALRGEVEAEPFTRAAGLASLRLAHSMGFDLPLSPLKGYSSRHGRGGELPQHH